MRKFNILFALGTLALLPTNSAFSQEEDAFKCGLPNRLEKLYEAYPGLEEDQRRLIEQSKHVYTSGSGDREEVYTIPVVFHVLHLNGTENISDQQIFDQMEILNLDYRKQNADTSDIVETFKPIAADAKIEFKLANKDPFGNCTNGIEHIYTHETNIGDDYSKLNQWPRSRYLNIWVVNSMESGVAGYSYYPSAVSGALQYADGVIIRNNYIGSIGTSSSTNSRALTHEIGHWLGLPHTWGSTNSPGVACGDDSIEDTPVTAGHTVCNLVDTDNCVEGVEENVQNYMEYAYCSNMFTLGQSAVMTTSLENTESSRNNLHTDETLENTGINADPVLCTPLPDFFKNKEVICAGGTMQFSPNIARATVDTYNWHFPGGTPEYSTETEPTVTYSTPGAYDVELTVTNAAGSETIVKTKEVYALADYWQHNGPFLENFENDHFDTDGWIVINPENNESKWERFENAGYSGNHCLGIQHYKSDLDPILDRFYYERMGGVQDVLISPSFNLNSTASASLNFKYIFATASAGLFEPEQLNLRISYWKECAGTWSYLTNLSADDLVCKGYVGESFLPGADDSWQSVSVSIPESAKGTNVRFRIEFTAEDFSNNFFIDDFNISGVLTTDENKLDLQDVTLYPNPVEKNQTVRITYQAPDGAPVYLEAFDLLGNQLMTETLSSVPGSNTQTLSLSDQFESKGVYLIRLRNENSIITKRLVVE